MRNFFQLIHKLILAAIFLVVLFPLASKVEASEDSYTIKQGEELNDIGLTASGDITYKGEVVFVSPFSIGADGKIFSYLKVLGFYNGKYYLSSTEYDWPIHMFYDSNTNEFIARTGTPKWFSPKLLNQTKDGRFVFVEDVVEGVPVFMVVDLENLNFLNYYGGFWDSTISPKVGEYWDYENTPTLLSFTAEENGEFTIIMQDLLGNKYTEKKNVFELPIMQDNSYDLVEFESQSTLYSKSSYENENNNLTPTESKKHNIKYSAIFIVFWVILLLALIILKEKKS